MLVDNEDFMTSREVCRYCGFSMSVLNSLESAGTLAPKRRLPVSRRRMYSREDVDNFLVSLTPNVRVAECIEN